MPRCILIFLSIHKSIVGISDTPARLSVNAPTFGPNNSAAYNSSSKVIAPGRAPTI